MATYSGKSSKPTNVLFDSSEATYVIPLPANGSITTSEQKWENLIQSVLANHVEAGIFLENFRNDHFSFRRLIMFDDRRNDARQCKSGTIQRVHKFRF